MIVALAALCSLAFWIIPEFGKSLPAGFPLMKLNSSLAALAGVASLALSLRPPRTSFLYLEQLLAAVMGLIAAVDLFAYATGAAVKFDSLFAHGTAVRNPDQMSPQSGVVFLLLAAMLFFIHARRGIFLYIADAAMFGVTLAILMIGSEFLFNATHLFGPSNAGLVSAEALFVSATLGLAAITRRAQSGVLSVFLNTGISGRITRSLAPIVILLPFLREAGRVRLMSKHWLPEHYAAAIMASMATTLSMGLLLFIGWRIYKMEREIEDLSLRDELTGLYNLRGFRLMAEQALLLAARAELPFSVLFIDLNNLKLVNDTLGHAVGSTFLTETGELLKASFRETDVLGRVGGDEFAIAGQFSRTAISIAATRLEEQAALGPRASGSDLPLSFSIGYTTSELRGYETLQDLLNKADSAMYDQKRRKKLQLC